MITEKLIEAIKEQYALEWHGIHGIRHWGRVYANGLRLAAATGARVDVVKLFAVFHDAARLNNGSDDGHGPRGARLAVEFRGRYFDLPDADFALLLTACAQHTVAKTHDDVTVRTCFDADRLDLPRVGKTPDPQLLCTDTARDPEIISWASDRSLLDFSPAIVSVWDKW